MKRLSRCSSFPSLRATVRVLYAATLACGGLCAIFFNCRSAVRSTLASEAAELPAGHSSEYTPFVYELLILALTAGGVELGGVLRLSAPYRHTQRVHELEPGTMGAQSHSEERGQASMPSSRESELPPTTSGWKELALEKPLTREWKNLRVLAVDDNSVNRQLLTMLLGKQGHTVVGAGNGKDALDMLETQAFDVILMDIGMPQMNGLEATARIRSREIGTGRHIPIVAVSAHAISGVKEKCLAVGMDQYVSLPLRKEDLFAAIAGSLKSTME